jgi:transcriptional regulator with XRE-family HTH domain
MTPLAERLRDLRAKAEISTRDLDRLAGLSPGHTYLLESGAGRGSRVSADVALALAYVFGVELEWLINGKGEAPTQRQVRGAVNRASANPRPRTGTEG